MTKPRALSQSTLFFLFEFGVGLLGAFLIYIWPGISSSIDWHFSKKVFIETILFSLPPLTFALIVTSSWGIRQPGIRSIYQALSQSMIGQYIRSASWPSFLLLSLAAGFGEELLFRGFVQAMIGIWWASLIFGLLHAVSISYLIIATVIGVYLGYVYQLSQHALLVPALIHSIYDFVALLLYRRRMNLDPPIVTIPKTETIEENHESNC